MVNDPRLFVDDWINGKLNVKLLEQHDALRICEQALVDDHANIVEELEQCLSNSERAFLDFRRAQMSSDAENAQEYLAKALEISRTSAERDHLLEARIRMEWGVLRNILGQSEESGVDLKWAMERLNALSEGHPWHGVSCLNMAEWHRNRGEWGMALAIYSNMSRHGPHMTENVAHSRRRAAEIHIEINQMMNASRNLWIAHHGFKESGLVEQSVEAGLHWLDIALENVNDGNALMEDVVENATPRSLRDPKALLQSHPDDVLYMFNWLDENIGSREGSNRPDLHVLADAADVLKLKIDLSGVEDDELLNRYS